MSNQNNCGVEKPMSLYQADLIEISSEHLQYHVEGYMLTGHTLSPEVEAFYKWCLQEDKEMLHCKRGRDGKSFHERREEANNEQKNLYEGTCR